MTTPTPPAPPPGPDGQPPSVGPKPPAGSATSITDDIDATQLSPNSEWLLTEPAEFPPLADAERVAQEPDPLLAGDKTVVLPTSFRMPAAEHPDVTQILPKPPDSDRWTTTPPPSAERETHTAPPSTLSPTLTNLPAAAAASTSLPAGSSSADAAVRQVGRYRIQSRLGRGGMATVYRAHDPSISRDVAIKFLHASLAEDDECRGRFLREARAAGGLSHPNIVVVHDVGEIEGRPYMAMELVEGEPLSETLEKTPMLPVRDVVLIGMQLARALEYAHARGIVHRDIKPGNIMVLKDGQTIKVTDFGIAHMDDGSSTHTQVGAVLGTPQYMSPEQALGEKIDGRSDLFAAGIVLYQMLAGERPFRADSLVAIAAKIIKEDPPPLAAKRPEVPAALRRVIDRCLAKKPDQRYQTGQELAEALKKVLIQIDAHSREKDKRRIVPLRVKWAATMALIVALVMGSTAALITYKQHTAMMGQVSDYGASMARFIAAQNAASVLGEDWEAVEVAVQEIMKTRNFERITVIDLGGTVRVSSTPGLAGQPYRRAGASPPTGSDNASVSRYTAGGESVLGFEAPVLFQDKQVGQVALGVLEAPVTQVARLSITLMIVLAVVTVLAVAVAMYFVANWFAQPIRLVCDSMAELAKGRLDHRIHEDRRDEFGELFNAFDALADALQAREASAKSAPAEPSA
jgi:HAMP domain-containing protein/predicted Ser/Thr protein kinase